MKIGIVYGHVASNIGDLAINSGVVGLLNRVAPDADVHVVLHNPNERYVAAAKESFTGLARLTYSEFETRGDGATAAERNSYSLGLAEHYTAKPLEFLEDTGLSDCDSVLYNSGEHLFSYEDRRPSTDLVWRILPALAARAAGIRFITLPATFGPFENPETDGLFREFFKLNHALAAREPRSARLVKELTRTAEPPTLLDPAFFTHLREPETTRDEESLGIIMRLEGFGMRVGRYGSNEVSEQLAAGAFDGPSLRFAVDVAERFIADTGGEVKLFVQSGANDRALTEAILRTLDERGVGERCRLLEPLSVSDYQRELSALGLVVAARFHACILGLVAGTPVIGVHFGEHGHKMPGLFELLEVPDFCIGLTQESVGEAASSALQLYSGRAQASSSVASRMELLRDMTARWLAESLDREVDIAGLTDVDTAAGELLRTIRLLEEVPSRAAAGRNNALQSIKRWARRALR